MLCHLYDSFPSLLHMIYIYIYVYIQRLIFWHRDTTRHVYKGSEYENIYPSLSNWATPSHSFFLVHHPQFGEQLLFGAKFPQATETIGPQISTNRDIFPEKCDASTQLRWIQPTMVRSMANWGYGRWNHTSTWSRNLRFRSEPQVKVIGSLGVGSHHLQQFAKKILTGHWKILTKKSFAKFDHLSKYSKIHLAPFQTKPL